MNLVITKLVRERLLVEGEHGVRDTPGLLHVYGEAVGPLRELALHFYKGLLVPLEPLGTSDTAIGEYKSVPVRVLVNELEAQALLEAMAKVQRRVEGATIQ